MKASRFSRMMQPIGNEQPIFLVGTPRSGTTLLAALLTSHSRISGGPETFFFSRLARVGASQITRNWPDSAAEFIESLRLEGDSVRRLYGLSQGELQVALKERAPSVRSALESLTTSLAMKQNKSLWLEKTPSHLLHLLAIRRAFPKATIVRIVRDARDVALSLQRVPWSSNCVLANVYRCVNDFEAANRFFESDSRCLTVKFERLIVAPEETLRRVCAKIGEKYEHNMIAGRSGARVATSREPWKEKIGLDLDVSRIAAWKDHFPKHLLPAADLIACDMHAAFGYPCETYPKETLSVDPWTSSCIERASSYIVEAASNGVRIMPVRFSNGAFNARRICSSNTVVFRSRPAMGFDFPKRIVQTLSLTRSLFWRRALGRPTFCEFSGYPRGKGKVDCLRDLTLKALSKHKCEELP